MRCKTLHKKIIFFLDGELSAHEMEQMKVHLLECNECSAFAEDMKKTLGVLETEKSHEINPFFYTRLKAKIENRASAQNERFRRPVFARILQPAIFSILLIAGIYSGIKIGKPVSGEMNFVTYSNQEIIPYLNEMKTESIEAFLME